MVWVVLLVIGYRGVMAIVLNETPPASSDHVLAAPAFPVQEASAYALQFGQVYLNASPAKASQRASDLAPFLPPSASDPQLGWNGGGSLSLQSEEVAGVRVQDAQHATITPLPRVNGTLMELGVPVYAKAGGMVVSGEPAWLAAPATATPPSPPPVNSDDAAQSALMRQLPAFFAAYASGDQSTLGRFLAPGTTAANLEMTYALTIVKQHGTWYVQSIAPSTRAGGQPRSRAPSDCSGPCSTAIPFTPE